MIHHGTNWYQKRMSCGVLQADCENRYSTTAKEITCPECLEVLYQKKRKELNLIAQKLGPDWHIKDLFKQKKPKRRFGFIVEIDRGVPEGEIHLRQGGKTVGKITGVTP